MSLEQTPPLHEGLSDASRIDPRAATQSNVRSIGSQSDVRQPVEQSRARKSPSRGGLGASGGRWGAESGASSASHSGFSIPLSRSTLQAARVRQSSSSGEFQYPHSASSSREITRRPSTSVPHSDEPFDPRFPTSAHREIHNLPAAEAVKRLRTIWDQRHQQSSETQSELDWNRMGGSQMRPMPTGRKVSTGQKNRLPPTVPGMYHQDPRVRTIAAKMQAHSLANSLGNTWDRKPGEEPVRAKAHVIRNTSTGALSTIGQFRGTHTPYIPKGHEVVYTAVSESLRRQPLVVETLGSSKTQRPSSRGARFSLAPGSNRGRPSSETQVLPAVDVRSLDSAKSKRPDETQILSLPRTISSSIAYLSPVLQEIVTNAFVSRFPAGTRLSGAPGMKGVTDTSNVGLVSAQGGIVPDKRKRSIVLPKPEKLPKGRDPITKQLETQPAFIGIVSRTRSRTESVLGEATTSIGFQGRAQSPSGPNMDLPRDDYVAAYRQFRSECPFANSPGHASFCDRCDNSWPSAVGGANMLRREDIAKLNPYGMNPFEENPEPITPRIVPRESSFGRTE